MNINFHICALFGQYQIGCCGYYCLVKIHSTRLGIVISFIFHHDPVNHFCDPYLFVLRVQFLHTKVWRNSYHVHVYFFDTCLCFPVAKLWQVPLEYYFHVIQFFFFFKKKKCFNTEALHVLKQEEVSITCTHVLILFLFHFLGFGGRGLNS